MAWIGASLNQRNALSLAQGYLGFQHIVFSQLRAAQRTSQFNQWFTHLSECRGNQSIDTPSNGLYSL